MKKRVLIIVRGAKLVKFNGRFLETLRGLYFRWLTSDRGILDKDYLKLRAFLENDYNKIESIHWNGDILHGDFSTALLELSDIIRKHKGSTIDVIGISMGGLIAQRALLYNPQIKINKLILIGAIFREKREVRHVKRIYNIFSEKDRMYQTANKLLTTREDPKLRGKNVSNISLKNVTHNDLCRNKKIKQSRRKEERLFELYRNLLLFK
jgi:pimeloyl-ACP methyl ester carboxylesterase